MKKTNINLWNLISAHEKLIDDHNIPVMWTKKIYLFYKREKNLFENHIQLDNILYEIIDILYELLKTHKKKKKENLKIKYKIKIL